MSVRIFSMKQLREEHEDWFRPSEIVITKKQLSSTKRELLERIRELEAENARLKRQCDFLVTDLIDVASDYNAPMSDCRICDYSRFCQRRPEQWEPVREMCEAAVLKSCEPRENGE